MIRSELEFGSCVTVIRRESASKQRAQRRFKRLRNDKKKKARSQFYCTLTVSVILIGSLVAL